MPYKWVYDFLENPSFWPQCIKKQGYYNTNYLVRHDFEWFVVRVPKLDVPRMDQQFLSENQVLVFLANHHVHAPRLLYDSPGFSVHSCIIGDSLIDYFPQEKILPDWMVIDLVHKIVKIHNLPVVFENPSVNFESVKAHILDIYDHYSCLFEELFKEFFIPPRSSLIPSRLNHSLSCDKQVFAHCDIHRKNLLVIEDSMIYQELVIIDWELAKIVPFTYDLASHLHKIGYSPNQEQSFLHAYARLTGLELDSFLYSVSIYRELEVIKSAVVDLVRLWSTVQRKSMFANGQVFKLVQKLKAADDIWKQSESVGKNRSYEQILASLSKLSSQKPVAKF